MHSLGIQTTRFPPHHAANANDSKNGASSKITSCFKNATEGFSNSIRNGVSFLAFTASQMIGVQSLCKLGNSAISFAKYVFSAQTEGFNNLREQLDTVDSALNVADFVASAKRWVVPEVDHTDGRKKFFWRHKEVTKWKIIGHAIGTVSKILGVAKFLMDVGLVKLGHLSEAIGTIPFFSKLAEFSPLKLFKDTLTIVYSTLYIVDTGLGLKKLNAKGKIVETKLAKWQIKNQLLDYCTKPSDQKSMKLTEVFKKESVPEKERETVYFSRLFDKYLSCRLELQKLGVKPRKENPLRGEDTPADKWNATKTHYQDGDLKVVNTIKCQKKVGEKQIALNKNKVSKTDSWLSTAFNVAKIAALVIGIAGIFAGAYVMPAFLAIIATAWLVVSAIGMGRLYYGFKYKDNK